MAKAKHKKETSHSRPTPSKEAKQKTEKKPLLLPVTVVFFVLVWLWAWLWYGDVFRIAREYAFWSPDETLMYYMEGRPWGGLWWVGLALLQLYRWPILGALITALLISTTAWLTGYCLRLRGWWRLLQYLPSAAYLFTVAYVGFDLYFEAEPGKIMGIPLLAFFVLLILALIIRSFSHHHTFPHIILPPTDETPRLNRAQLLLVTSIILATMGITLWMRPYVRIVTTMQTQMMEQDWKGMAKTAHRNPELSYRAIAAYYAISLVQTGEVCSRLFDIRLDYDDPYIHNFDGAETNGNNYYIPDCDLYAGLVQTCIHHAMENMTMNGPNLRALKLLTKCALLKGEWKVAEKYLHILQHTPFEGDFIDKYRPMIYHPELVDADPEFKMIRLTEPIHDNFENFLVQPIFLGYNATLMEGRSINALWNSLMVHIYTKSMPQFIERCTPIQGTMPPQSIAEALMLMSSKYPQMAEQFPAIEYNRSRLMNFLQDVRSYMSSHESRAAHARELFPKYKGYYPYYYFFGNLKATKRKDVTAEGSSNQGVN